LLSSDFNPPGSRGFFSILLKKALEIRSTQLGEEHLATLESMHELGVLYASRKQYEQAEPLLLKAIKGRDKRLSASHPATLGSLDRLVKLYEAWGKAEKAEQWRTKKTAGKSPK